MNANSVSSGRCAEWLSRGFAAAAGLSALRAAVCWTFVLIAGYVDTTSVSTSLYLSRCPHGFSMAPRAWFGQALEHVAVFPLGSISMAAFCLVRNSSRRSYGWSTAIVRTVAMLLIMPLTCEWAWEASGYWSGAFRSDAFLAANVAIFGLLELIGPAHRHVRLS